MNRNYNTSSVPAFGGALTSATVRNEFGSVSTGFTGVESELDGKVTLTTAQSVSGQKTFTAPILGAATATSINKVTLTAPATGSALTIADGKTLTANGSTTLGLGGIVLDNAGGLTCTASKVLTVSNTLTLAGTDSTTMTFPSTSQSIVGIKSGALASGSANDLGSSTITTTGAVATGALTVTGTGSFSNTVTLSLGGTTGTGSESSGILFTGAGTNTKYAGMFFNGDTVYSSYFGRIPAALSGINDGVAYCTNAGAGMVIRTLFSSTGLSVTGIVTPEADNTRTLGTGALRWSTVYAGTGTINTSDAREKTTVSALTANEINAAKQIAKEIGSYKWLSSVTEKGDAARCHIGLTVQKAISILEANSLDAMAYGFICYDKWDDVVVEHPAIEAVEAQDATFDEDGNELTPAVEAVEAKAAWSEVTIKAGDRYSFRMDELNLFIAAGFEARLAALENK